ncbi:hypothetical protein GGTG_00752 [Gaeumannomyces tritici R3-111a-1]|uniref:Uncharacterized protein n=1 Tax=Gaeumannomyces tritici (strain R3-111a-1) TaxID=644352 RepID=J3NHL5_GAET3|nr:hypothetical protein GGTG_00752 [Gaeumannomyces tritici R3-111a-1]EJT80758.1 hypothetical protein GGTG_00752 [Gaeumannomyces tritici R3-111a-1]
MNMSGMHKTASSDAAVRADNSTHTTQAQERGTVPQHGRSRRREDGRAQPWLQHWPPSRGTAVSTAYGFKKGETVHIYGN